VFFTCGKQGNGLIEVVLYNCTLAIVKHFRPMGAELSVAQIQTCINNIVEQEEKRLKNDNGGKR
jgi:hypothetical protein